MSRWAIAYLASTTNKIRLASWMADTVCLKISSLRPWPTLRLAKLASTPGVSITDANPFNMSNYLRSRVVPYSLSTTATRSPTKQLNKLLFPLLGNPTKATLNLSWLLARVFHGRDRDSFPWSLASFRVIKFYICCGVCKMSCEFLARREKANLLIIWNRNNDIACLINIVYIIIMTIITLASEVTTLPLVACSSTLPVFKETLIRSSKRV